MTEIPDCIIVAAGRSSRMKSWKPGLAWGDSTILETMVDTALDAGCRVIVVGGYRFRMTSGLLAGRDNVTVVRAWRWRKGMDVSIRRGIREVISRRFFVVPADMPLIRASDYRRLLGEKGGSVIRPVRGDVPGHPVLFSSKAIPVLLKATPGTALRHSLKHLNKRSIKWDHDGVVMDLDTTEEYRSEHPGDQ